MKKFVVRANNYNYNDENYYIESAGKLEAIFDTADEAVKLRDTLNIDALKDFGKNRLPEFLFNADDMEGKIEKLRAYYMSNFRIDVDVDQYGYASIMPLPETATSTQLLEIMQLAGIRPFDVHEFDIEKPMFEIQYNPEFWGEVDYDPFTIEFGRSFYFNEDDAFAFVSNKIAEAFWEDTPGLKGSFEELSDHPDLLKAYTEQSKTLAFKSGVGIVLRDKIYEIPQNEIRGLVDLLRKKPYKLSRTAYSEAAKLAGTEAPQPNTKSNYHANKKWWQFWK